MPDLYLDVDTAVTVPVNLYPLIDDTDFKTREVAVAYDAAGMDLVWNFVTSAGVITQTAVTPTTGGNYDWSHVGDGIYKIEIPASGGASINNDTEGYGWFSGLVTGVLPFRGPVIGFRAAGLNDLLCDSAYSATRGLAGTALPAAAADAAGGLPISDAGGLDLDAQIGADIDAILVDTGTTLDGRIPAALVSGRMDSSVGAYASGQAPLQPATAGRTLVVDAAGLADANVVKVGPTAAGTAQTARDLGASVLVGDKTGFSLAATGLDAITATEPSAKPTTFPGWLMWLVQRFRRSTCTATTLTVKTEAGATVTSQAVADDGTTESLGAPS